MEVKISATREMAGESMPNVAEQVEANGKLVTSPSGSVTAEEGPSIATRASVSVHRDV